MPSNISRAVSVLKNGGVVAFPTETVYGLGACVSDERGIKKIFKVKGRPQDNPLIVHISDLMQLNSLAKEIPSDAVKLMRRFWPGPLTLIFKKKAVVSDFVTAGLPTVAVRMPKHPVARKLLKALGEPIAAPSANRSGRPSSTTSQHVSRELKGKVDYVLSGSASKYGLESTVVHCGQKPFRLLRPGSITLEALQSVVPHVRPRAIKIGSSAAVPSPGLKHKHYQPSCPVVLVKPAEWKQKLSRLLKDNRKVGILSMTQSLPRGRGVVLSRHFHGDRAAFARELYSLFFLAEQRHVQVLAVESISNAGLGRAIMDRLVRASNGE